MIRLGIQA